MDESGTRTTGQGGTMPTNNTGVNAEDDWVLDPTLFLVSFAKARIFFDLKQKSSYANAILRRLDEFYIWAKLNDLCHLVPQQTEHESIAQIIGAYYDGNIEFKRKIEQGFQAIGIKKPKADIQCFVNYVITGRRMGDVFTSTSILGRSYLKYMFLIIVENGWMK